MKYFIRRSTLFYCITLLFIMNFAGAQSKSKSLNDSIVKYFFSNPNKAKTYSHKFLKIAKQNNLSKEESNAYFYIADLCGAMSQKDSVFYYYDKAIQKAIDIDNKEILLYHKINKANYLFYQYYYEESLALFEECIKLAKKNIDIESYNFILVAQGKIHYELENYDKALYIFKQGIKSVTRQTSAILSVKHNLAKTYIKLNEIDSAFTLINEGIQLSTKKDIPNYKIAFLQIEASAYIERKQYLNARKSYDKALLISNEMESLEDSNIIKLDIARLLTLEKKHLEAINLLNELNEFDKKSPFVVEIVSEIYYLLAENYKSINEFSKSNDYYQKFIEKSKKLSQKKIETIDYLHKIKVAEVEEQKFDQSKQKWTLAGMLLVVSLCILLYFFYIKKRDTLNQDKFEALLQKISNYEEELSAKTVGLPAIDNVNHLLFDDKEVERTTVLEENPIAYQETEEDNNTDELENEEEEFDSEIISQEDDSVIIDDVLNNSFVIKDGTITEILDKLIKLEEKKYFLKQECTLHSVAKKLKTNTAYLSKIVNNELGKSFSTYINELRINYIIIELKNNAKLRSYSVNAIAEEVGYKRPESFTKYFKDATGITPAVYIRKISKLKEV
ncbi:helix-turn-helix domain-containing protein [Flavobacterium sp.]|uniref:helix-turn-helix domain-containing protein n=1 Tax=Flavobacterium sp. TaxID=239 RepID=UPI0037536FC5